MDTNNNYSETVKTFIPIQFSKGKDKDGKTVMKMKGIASTSSKDADGEHLDPSGFQMDYFMKNGYMNWNHQTNKDPLSIIGTPTSAKVEKGEMHLECELFPNSEVAKSVYKLGEILEKQGKSLGYSIEGSVIERDPNNPKIVKKAKITGCAITPNPKNTDSVAKIVKGLTSDELNSAEDDLLKAITQAIKDEEEEKKKKEKEKAISAESASGRAVTKESLATRAKYNRSEEDMENDKKMSKSEVMQLLAEKYPDNTINQHNQIYNIIQKTQVKMEEAEKKVSSEAIEKALETLNLHNSTSSNGGTSSNTEGSDIEKGMKGAQKDAQGTKAGGGDEVYMMYKGEKYMMGKGGDHYMKGGKKYMMKAGKMEMMNEEKKDDMKKSESENQINTQTSNDDLIKGITDAVNNKFESIKDDLGEKVTALGTLQKSVMEEVEILKKGFADLSSQPGVQKSITTQNYIQKGENDSLSTQNQNGGHTLNHKNKLHKGVILKACDTILDPDNYPSNPPLADAIYNYENGGQMNSLLKGELNKLEGITVV